MLIEENHHTLSQKRLHLLLKDCAKGFYQQMYFLGKDVTHPSGNMLQTYGFQKSPSKGLKGTSCYTYQTKGEIIELYGACAGYYSAEKRVVFLRKQCNFFQWLPAERMIAGLWNHNDIESLSAKRMLKDVTPLLKWWVSYEQWIKSQLGTKYRGKCYKEWGKIKNHTPWLDPDLGPEWVKQFLREPETQVRTKHFKG